MSFVRESVNHWPDTKCARAFWGQQELPAYRELLADTTAWLEPRADERWLDLGCGCGKLTEALWQRSTGQIAEIVGLDCAAVNQVAFERLSRHLEPTAQPHQIQFVHDDFSDGLAHWPAESFHGVVSGLAIQYAEHFDDEQDGWTTAAYDAVLAEVHRLLVPGASFVFSVNVPEPRWRKVAWEGFVGAMEARQPHKYLKRARRMWRYGSWLTRESRRGRFHYLPIGDIAKRLRWVGFEKIEHRLSYAGLAYLIRCRKSGQQTAVSDQPSVPS